MLFGLPIDYVAPIATILGLAVIGAFAELGRRWGARTLTPSEKTYEIAGALVDSKSIEKLTASIEANSFERITSRVEGKALAEKMVRAIEGCTDEMAEVRSELRQLGDAVSRRR